jgi:hypothetical protein
MGRVPTGRTAARVRPITVVPTSIARLPERPPPVFADPAGARRRTARHLSYALGLLVALVLLAFWLSQVGP